MLNLPINPHAALEVIDARQLCVNGVELLVRAAAGDARGDAGGSGDALSGTAAVRVAVGPALQKGLLARRVGGAAGRVRRGGGERGGRRDALRDERA